jgi:hypothetical protein
MQVIEAQCASILEPHDHLHISQKSACKGCHGTPIWVALCGACVCSRVNVSTGLIWQLELTSDRLTEDIH